MALPYSFIGSGTYVNPATLVTQNVALTDKPDWFYVKDITLGSTTAGWGAVNGGNYVALNPIYAEWFSNMPNASFLGIGQSAVASGAASMFPSQGTTGGFTFINLSNPPTFSAVTNGTTIDKTTFVALTATTTGIAVGDYVRITSPTGMLQIGGMSFQVTAVNSGVSLTLGYMATAVTAGLSIAANATAFTYRKFIPNPFYPREKFIAFITQATQAKVYFTSQNDFTPGELVDFQVPGPYGMIQISNLALSSAGPARVLSVTNTATESSITLNLDTTGFTAFKYPTSAAFATGASPAVCFPAGSGLVPLSSNTALPQPPPGTNLQDAFDNRSQYLMLIGTSACGVAGATMQWMAFKSDFNNAISNA